ncbi:MAG: glycosidase [Dehalococcoidia bacterium]
MLNLHGGHDRETEFKHQTAIDYGRVRDEAGKPPFEEIEDGYRKAMEGPVNRVRGIGEADIVVGIPFYNEFETLPGVIETAVEGLNKAYPDLKSVIVAAGSPAGAEALRAVEEMPAQGKIERIAFIFDNELLNGKGWGIRGIFELADRLGSDVLILEADLARSHTSDEDEGFSPEWIRLLLDPVRNDKADMVVSRFNLHYFDAPVCNHLAYPLLAAVYNCPMRCLLGGQWGLSHRLLRVYLNNPRYVWETAFSGYGVDSWMAIGAITSNARICEACLGVKDRRHSIGKQDMVLRQLANAFFQEILNDDNWWTRIELAISVPHTVRLPVLGRPKGTPVKPQRVNTGLLHDDYRSGFNTYYSLYERLFDNKTYDKLERLSHTEIGEFDFPSDLWARGVYGLIIAYAFKKEFARGDLLSSLITLHKGFAASRARKLEGLVGRLSRLSSEERERIISIEADTQVEELVDEFRQQRPAFVLDWLKNAQALEPPVPMITYREFIPGVPLVVPTELVGREGNLVTANGVYDNIFSELKKKFEDFVYNRLQISSNVNSLYITLAIKDFLRTVEREFLPDSNLSTIRGVERVVRQIFDQFPHGEGFSLLPEAASMLLNEYPPVNLLTTMGYTNLADLLKEHDSRDMLALTRWTEEREYWEGLSNLMAEKLRPEHFGPADISFLVVKHEQFPSLVELRDSTSLDKLTSRIVVSNLNKGMGGEFPKLRYFTTIAKDIVEAERFGHIWRYFAEERKDFGRKVVNSIEGHWGREPLSAHNIFEDGNQRIMVERVRQMARNIAEENHRLAARLEALADSYHLALTLPDGKFITCSAWSWASYSFKGGLSSPPPLSIHVERDWASREFLVEYFKALGGSEEEVEREIRRLMALGREWENLAPILLGSEPEADRMLPSRSMAAMPKPPDAGMMTRFEGNPILKPIRDHAWESKYVLNAGSIVLEGKVYLAYRAFGDDEISRIGLAVSEDGFSFDERLPQPIFEPRGKYDSHGCEDPRLTLLGDRIYMAYTVFNGDIAQIALASISPEDFINYKWKAWRRHGNVFPRFTDKDAALFPEQFDGKYAILHRVDPHIWITFSPHLRCPWSRKEHQILAGATAGMAWDGRKIGAGAQPIKTRFGWLLITHGVDYARIYRLGVMVLELEDPSRLIYRSPNPVLEPATTMELGEDGKSWVSGVVFTCGAVPRNYGKDILDTEDELIVYYGAADSIICAATTSVGDLIPEEVRLLPGDSGFSL